MTVETSPGVRGARDVVLLLARIGLGVIMIAHAKLEWDFAGGSLAGVGQMFAQSGIPLPAISGPANVLFEFVGGVVPIVGVLMALNMVGAWVLVHTSPLFSMDHNGPELAIMIGLLSLVLAVVGSGRFGLDHLIIARRRARVTTGR
jgi:putative oxidoreductase